MIWLWWLAILVSLGLVLVWLARPAPPRGPVSYGVVVRYARGKPLHFPDFVLIYQGVEYVPEPGHALKAPILQFRVVHGPTDSIIALDPRNIWEATPFEVAGQPYELEFYYAGQFGIIGDYKLVISKC